MSTPINQKRRPRPNIGKNTNKAPERLKNEPIDYKRTASNLKEGVVYTGAVIDACILKWKEQRKSLCLSIELDKDKRVFETQVQISPMLNYSPLNAFLAGIEKEIGHKPTPNDLIDFEVEFTVKYNKDEKGRKYCNLSSIECLYDENADARNASADDLDDDDDTDDDDGEEDEDDEYDF